jgi:hypothetical protein
LFGPGAGADGNHLAILIRPCSPALETQANDHVSVTGSGNSVAVGLAIQLRLGIGGRGVGLVRPLLAAKVALTVAARPRRILGSCATMIRVRLAPQAMSLAPPEPVSRVLGGRKNAPISPSRLFRRLPFNVAASRDVPEFP